MMAVNSIATPQAATAFKGKDKKALDFIKKILPKEKSIIDQDLLEQFDGMAYAFRTHSKDEIKERTRRELLNGNTDFVKGVNEYLSGKTAKDVYKNIK